MPVEGGASFLRKAEPDALEMLCERGLGSVGGSFATPAFSMALVAVGEEVYVDWRKVDAAIEGAHPHPAAIRAFTLVELGFYVVVVLVGGRLALLSGVGNVARVSHGLSLAARAARATVSAGDSDVTPHQVMRLAGSQPRMATGDTEVPRVISESKSPCRIAAL